MTEAFAIEESYNIIKSIVISVYDSKRNVHDINTLKNSYNYVINSERRMSLIDNIQKLIEVLEKRDVLSPYNIDELFVIFKYFNLSVDPLKAHNNLLNSVGSTQNGQDNEELKIRTKKSNDLPRKRANYPLEEHCIQRPILKDQPKLLPEKVVKMVCSRIGYQWRSLARYLKCVQECVIDSIEEDDSIKSNELRARMIIYEYQENVHPTEVKVRLMKALRALQRKDIHDEVEKIFLEN